MTCRCEANIYPAPIRFYRKKFTLAPLIHSFRMALYNKLIKMQDYFLNRFLGGLDFSPTRIIKVYYQQKSGTGSPSLRYRQRRPEQKMFNGKRCKELRKTSSFLVTMSTKRLIYQGISGIKYRQLPHGGITTEE